ncbi:MAG: hypothetical protein AAGA99_20355 [Actinomycetota bacterium]
MGGNLIDDLGDVVGYDWVRDSAFDAAGRERRLPSIEPAGAPIVASNDPGWAAELQVAGVEVRHPMRLVADALRDRRLP